MLEIRGETRDDVDARQDNDPHKDVEESSNTRCHLTSTSAPIIISGVL